MLKNVVELINFTTILVQNITYEGIKFMGTYLFEKIKLNM